MAWDWQWLDTSIVENSMSFCIESGSEQDPDTARGTAMIAKDIQLGSRLDTNCLCVKESHVIDLIHFHCSYGPSNHM